MSLRLKIIKAAYEKPHLRPHLLPLLKEAQMVQKFWLIYPAGGQNRVLVAQLLPPNPWYSTLGAHVADLNKACGSLVSFLKKTREADGAKVVAQNDAVLRSLKGRGFLLLNYVAVPDVDPPRLQFLVSQWGRVAGYAPKNIRL